MKLKYGQPALYKGSMFMFFANKEALEKEPVSLKQMYEGKAKLYSTYVAKDDDIICLGSLKIPKGRCGNLNDYYDMVYFGTGRVPEEPGTYTVAVPIELVLLHKDAFDPLFEPIH